jgi:hypothetical protein
MKLKSLLSAGLAAVALGLVATTAQAAPAGGLVAAGDADRSGGLVEKVTWYGDRYYGDRYYGDRYYRPYRYGYRYHRPFYGHRYGYRSYGWYPRYGYRHW